MTTGMIPQSIVGILLLMLLLVLLLILIACKPWRLCFSSSSRSRSLKNGGEIERPLVSDDVDAHNGNNEGGRTYDIEGACYQNDGLLRMPRMEGLVHKPRVPSASPHVTPQGSCLSLEVISGPSSGQRCSVQSMNASRVSVTLGRVSTDLLFKDTEVSGKHAMINWNGYKKKWEVVDMGSLNGTLLNSQPINHHDPESRQWGRPVELSSGDIITLGTTSNIQVNVTSKAETRMRIPFGIGMASDPMALRRGGKKLPMEDVCYYSWPLPGIHEFGVFGVCDGHGGAVAAKSASKMLPEKLANILSDCVMREKVISQGNAADVLKIAFSQTEASLTNYYEGCTATVLLVWTDGGNRFFAQCANLGDSACVIYVDGEPIKMTEDHRVVSHSERLRMNGIGDQQLRDGETRLCGLNLARMLGDKYLKQQDARFSSEPYISEVVHIDQSSSSGSFAVLASDGFWDVVSVKKAVQLVQQANEKEHAEGENPAEKIANALLNEARVLRTKDNTSVLFLDFDNKVRSL
ncbi:unnamed protein product [Linum tenue]|uniref:protein-serine/threonine phosphatase n=1 Tax=Linum tenue TaxID=586396 RepID=A0AAV0RQK3_9ROSI|nr:unnamed protein product [Linum tenue]